MNPSQRMLTKTFRVSSNEADINGNLRPGALVNYLIQCAIDSADSLGFGLALLRETHAYWALSRLTIQMSRPIKWQEELMIQTWPKDISGLHFLRDFKIMNAQGGEIGFGLSGWLLVDSLSKRPQRSAPERESVFRFLKDHHAGNPSLLERIRKIPLPAQSETSVETTNFDYDINGHVTATRYIDWIMNTYPFDFLRNNFIHSLTINYIKEILPGDGVTLSKWEKEEGHSFMGTSQTHGIPAYLARIIFREI